MQGLQTNKWHSLTTGPMHPALGWSHQPLAILLLTSLCSFTMYSIVALSLISRPVTSLRLGSRQQGHLGPKPQICRSKINVLSYQLLEFFLSFQVTSYKESNWLNNFLVQYLFVIGTKGEGTLRQSNFLPRSWVRMTGQLSFQCFSSTDTGM